MTDEAAEPARAQSAGGNADSGPGPAGPAPSPSGATGPAGPADPAPEPTDPGRSFHAPTGAAPDPSPPPPPGGPGGPPPPPGGPAGGFAGSPPPPGGFAWGGSGGPGPTTEGFTLRYGLIRPRQGRYLAGVCAGIGRATNTDPVLWRVLLAVLGFFGGIGILIYIAAWLIIPGEGDTASPVESMLGRGRSSMSPVTVIVLGILVAVSFGFIVTDGFRAVLLGAVVLIGGALLLSRDMNRSGGPGAARTAPTQAPPPGMQPPSAPSGPVQPSASAEPTATFPAGGGFAPAGASSSAGSPTVAFPPAGHPGAPYPPAPSAAGTAGTTVPGTGTPASYPPPAYPAGFGPYPGAGTDTPAPGQAEPPTLRLPAQQPAPAGGPYAAPAGGGYRPPFAPHGPYAPTPYPPAAAPPRRTKPPKRPKERSALGAATFSLVFLAIGAVAVLDLTDVVAVPSSGYFATALVTVALGLLVGAWFGRARWLIALGLTAAAALGIATLVESQSGTDHNPGPVVWSPASYDMMANRYRNRFGGTLDLTRVDFTGRDARVSISAGVGSLTVIVPPNVDVTTTAQVRAGDIQLFDQHWSGVDRQPHSVTDLGEDGAGGGTLHLELEIEAGNVEVNR